MRLERALSAFGLLLALISPAAAQSGCGGQAGAGKFCGNNTGSTGLPGFVTIPSGSLTPIGGGTVLGNPTALTAAPIATAAPILGIPGTAMGQIGFAGAISGTVTIQPQGAAGTYNFNLPVSAGTTGLPLLSGGGGLSPQTYAVLGLPAGGTNANLTASNGGIFYSTATAGAILAGTATARQMLQSGTSAAPAWSTATWPATTAINQLLYSSTANVVGGLATANNGVLVTSGAGVPSIASSLPSGLSIPSPTITGSFTATGLVKNTDLVNSSLTVNGVTIALGASGTVTAAAGTLTGTTLNSSVVNSSLTSVGTLTGGATGAGFTVALGSSTVTGTLQIANGGLGATSFTAGLPIIGNGASNPTLGTITGTGTKFATATGSFTATNCLTTDANHNVVDNGVPCGTGTNSSNTQDFLAGVGFTAGTTTSLTVSATPINLASSYVIFDGVTQSHNTYTLSGSTYTFSAAIPANTKVVEIGWLSTTVLPTFVTSLGGVTGAVALGSGLFMSGSTLNQSMTSLGGVTGTITLGSGLFMSGSTLNQNIASVDNFLPNVNWQLFTHLGLITKQNQAGTGNQTSGVCSGFDTTNNQPTLTCSATGQIKAGDLVLPVLTSSGTSNNFWGYSGTGTLSCSNVQCYQGLYVTASRVVRTTLNSNIVIQGNFSGVSPASSGSLTAIPISIGDVGGTSGAGPDGWTKTISLTIAPDDFAANATPGAIRTLLVRKGASSPEYLQWSPPETNLTRYLGMPITCGVQIKGAAGGGYFWIYDDVNGYTYSSAVTGAGSFQLATVQATPAANATIFAVGYQLNGANGDPSWIAVPTCGIGTQPLVLAQLHQNVNERIRANGHFNPPLLTPFQIQFTIPLATGLYGFNNIDLEAISLGAVHKSIGAAWAKIEWTTSALGATLLTGSNISSNLIFGPQAYTTVVNQTTAAGPSLIPIYHDGTFTMFTGTGGLMPTSATFDFQDVEASNQNGVN